MPKYTVKKETEIKKVLAHEFLETMKYLLKHPEFYNGEIPSDHAILRRVHKKLGVSLNTLKKYTRQLSNA